MLLLFNRTGALVLGLCTNDPKPKIHMSELLESVASSGLSSTCWHSECGSLDVLTSEASATGHIIAGVDSMPLQLVIVKLCCPQTVRAELFDTVSKPNLV